jgi:hypothetical protein
VAFDLLHAICSATAFGLMIVILLLLPEAHGRPGIDRCRNPCSRS